MLQIPHTALLDILAAVYPYVQLFTVVSIIFGFVWWLQSSREQLFTKIDKITDNHLTHIELGITKLSDSMPQFFKELHDHQTKAEVLLTDIRETQRRQEQ
jgi:cell shape-determining protein MreC